MSKMTTRPGRQRAAEEYVICCDAMRHAFDSGTDGEGYGAVFWLIGGNVFASSHDVPLSVCPWCRKEIKNDR